MPWADPVDIESHCSRCGVCVDVCPEKIVRQQSSGFPSVDFVSGSCTFCGQCAEVCPAPVFAIDRTTSVMPVEISIGKGCLANQGVSCRCCEDACGVRAIHFRPRAGGVSLPRLDPAACTGCGACLSACPADAFQVVVTRCPASALEAL